MTKKKLALLLSILSFPLGAVEVLLSSSNGNELLVDVDPQTSIECLQNNFEAYVGTPVENSQILVAYTPVGSCKAAKPITNTYRNYYQPLSKQDRSQIAYIVRTCANKPTPTLLFYKSALEKAGATLDHLHPFRFLEAIFTDDELIVGVRVIRKKDWVWGDFFGGLKGSLTEESARDNVKLEHIIDFSQKLRIDPNLIIPALNNKQWSEFADILIEHVPRNNNPSRYGM